MMARYPISAAAFLLACSFAGALLAEGPTFPADAQLVEPLGFRPKPGLDEVFVIKGSHYLAKGTKVRLLDSNPAFGSEGAFCRAEAHGHKGYLRCDKPHAFKFVRADTAQRQQAQADQAQQSPAQQSPVQQSAPKHKGKAHLGQYCNGEEDCKAFCQKHCTLNPSAWKSTCQFPAGLGGSIAEGSSELKKLPAMKHVSGSSSVRATQESIEGLQRLDEYIGSSSSWPKDHTVYVHSCYRSDKQDSTGECDYILKGWHIRAKWAGKTPSTPAEQKEKATGDRLVNPPRNLGLMWPGATPHSAGLGCDLVVRDPSGKDATSCRMTDNAKQRELSKALVDAMTGDKVGAVRLNYEGWHFEWGGAITTCRCKGAECNDKHWPTPCDGGQHCARPK
jgi:hypothetical protein